MKNIDEIYLNIYINIDEKITEVRNVLLLWLNKCLVISIVFSVLLLFGSVCQIYRFSFGYLGFLFDLFSLVYTYLIPYCDLFYFIYCSVLFISSP